MGDTSGHEKIQSKQTLAYPHGSETTASHRLSIDAPDRLVECGEGSNGLVSVDTRLLTGQPARDRNRDEISQGLLFWVGFMSG